MLIPLDPTGVRNRGQVPHRMAARLADMPDYPYFAIGRTRTSLCDWDDATVAAVAKEIADETMALLGPAADGRAAQ